MVTSEIEPSKPPWNSAAVVYEDAIKDYNGGEAMPLGGYSILMALYGTAFIGGLLTAKRGSFRKTASLQDLAVLGVAAHKVSRLITRDWVTAPLRAPFTEYQGSAGAGEVKERARGTGLRRAVGDLLTCPFCFGAWTATAFSFGFLFSPAKTRFVAQVFVVETISDWLHLLYQKKRADVEG